MSLLTQDAFRFFAYGERRGISIKSEAFMLMPAWLIDSIVKQGMSRKAAGVSPFTQDRAPEAGLPPLP